MSEQPATESLSIEQRLAAQFEPEQPETEQQEEQQGAEVEASATESEAQPEFHEVEFEGKTYQVPPELKDALLRQSDYTRKTTEAAEKQRAIEQKELQFKAFEAEKQFRASAQPDIDAIQEIDFQLKQWKAVDVQGMQSEQLWQLKTKIDDLKEQKAEAERKLNSKWQQFNGEQKRLADEAKAKALEHVSKSIKGWGPDAAKAIRDHALSKGFTQSEVDGIGDPRVVEVLWEAQQYRKLQSQALQGKVKTVPTVKPGSSNPMPQHVKDKFAYNKQIASAKTSAQKAQVIQKRLESMF